MTKYYRMASRIIALAASVWLLGLAMEAFLANERPPQPLAFGDWQWTGEVGMTVGGVTRTSRLSYQGQTIAARGEFYVVHALVCAPFGLRPHWDDADAIVRTFSGTGGTMRGLEWAVDEPAQHLLDRMTGRPGPQHEVRGALEHEDLVFDLPRDVEQPGFIFRVANQPARVLDWIFLSWWQPRRFNLRYD